LEILDKNSNAYTEAPDWDPLDATVLADNACEVQSSSLKSSFGYEKGDKIMFRLNAENEQGPSEWAYPADGDATATAYAMLIL